MENTSKDLLYLEQKCSSSSPLESTLLVCNKKDSTSQTRESHLDKKPHIAPLPKSQVLGKVKNFLGVISEANKKLELEAKDNAGGCNIEALSGNESEVIEMDLMLGVADLHTPEAVAAAEAAIAGRQIPLATSSSGSESEDSSDDDDNNNDDSDDEDDEEDDYANNNVTKSSPTEHKRFKTGKDDSSSGAVGGNGSKKQSKIVELS